MMIQIITCIKILVANHHFPNSQHPDLIITEENTTFELNKRSSMGVLS